jgi:DNA-binding NarL/FixJ family response regulator
MAPSTGRTHADSRLAGVRIVAVIGSVPWHLHDALDGVDDYDVVLVAPAAHAYSKIKGVRPDVVVMCASLDDVDACNVLSMLALDRDTSSIPVLTYLMPDAAPAGYETPETPALSLTPESMN